MHNINKKEVRHVLSLSGGKDSTALAIYMRDRVDDMEYVFCDTGEELEETYDYLDKIEAYLGKKVIRLNPDRPFQHYLEVYNGVLPDARTRWCTKNLKIRPFEKYIGSDKCINYIGIRADENRKGYISSRPNLKPKYPFIEDGINKEDVYRILEESGLGLSDYYKWRSRSGCYFCFFQQRIEWAGLHEHHPDLYKKAAAYEKHDPATGKSFTWSQRESLLELARPERIKQIKADHQKLVEKQKANIKKTTLTEILCDEFEDDRACLICDL